MSLPYPEFEERLKMVRVLQAEESLRRVTEIAAGNGLIEKHPRAQILAAWRRDAAMNERKKQTTLDTLIGHGIGLKFVKKKRTTDG